MPDQNQPKEETTHKMRNLGETLTPHKYKATYVRPSLGTPYQVDGPIE